MSQFANFEVKIAKTLESLKGELATLRAGRANAAVLDRIQVDYYGTMTPVQQMAQVSVPEPQSLVISPYDATTLKSIEQAIAASDLGINPQNDGKVIRLNFPSLTEERRKDLTKQVGKYTEDSKVAIRNLRRDAVEAAKKEKKDGDMTEDDLKNAEKEIQNITDKAIKKIDEIRIDKEKELLKV